MLCVCVGLMLWGGVGVVAAGKCLTLMGRVKHLSLKMQQRGGAII